MIVIRSFDVNKPGEEVQDLRGGVAGGSILQGVLRLGQEIEIRPGIVQRGAEGKVKCVPLFSRIVSLFAEQNDLQYAVPGGLIGVGTHIDPTLTRADRLVGQVGSRQAAAHVAGVHQGGREGGALQARGEALASHRMGPDPGGCPAHGLRGCRVISDEGRTPPHRTMGAR